MLSRVKGIFQSKKEQMNQISTVVMMYSLMVALIAGIYLFLVLPLKYVIALTIILAIIDNTRK